MSVQVVERWEDVSPDGVVVFLMFEGDNASDVVQAPSGPYDQNGIPTAAEMGRRSNLLTGLAVMNPEMASQLSETFKNMDAGQVAAVTARHTRLSQIAAGILQLPQNQRAAALQQAAPELQSLGLNPQQISGVDLSDNGLRQYVAEGMDIERVAEFAKPQITEVRQGSTQRIVNPNQTSSTVFESPTVVGPEGQVFARPPQMSTMPQTRTATGAHGEKYQLNPQTNQWELIGGQTPPASGNFQ